MPDLTTLLFLYAETPLHAGIGRQADAAIDQPIQRQQGTNYPIVRASTLKGALRAHAARLPAEEVANVFGPPPETPEAGKFASALAVGDALTLLFPVRSLAGVFAWVTSPAILASVQRDAASHGVSLPWQVGATAAGGEAGVAPDSQVRGPRGRLTLEDLTFAAHPDPQIAALGRWLAEHAFASDPAFAYWREKVERDIVLLPDDAFRFFVTQSTEVASRIRIDLRTGAAAEGALWTEEALPVDTLLYAPLWVGQPSGPGGALNSAAEVLRWLRDLLSGPLQIGGSRTLGRGFVHPRLAETGSKEAP